MYTHTRKADMMLTDCVNTYYVLLSSYTDDETSPLVCDPYNEEEYTYSILSKALIKNPAKPVAGAATPVTQGECEDESAQNAQDLLKETGRVTALHSSKTGLASQLDLETETDHSSLIQNQVSS